MNNIMKIVCVNTFRNNLEKLIEQIVGNHSSLKVTRCGGQGFVVISAGD